MTWVDNEDSLSCYKFVTNFKNICERKNNKKAFSCYFKGLKINIGILNKIYVLWFRMHLVA